MLGTIGYGMPSSRHWSHKLALLAFAVLILALQTLVAIHFLRVVLHRLVKLISVALILQKLGCLAQRRWVARNLRFLHTL
jgi:hypothetical protein